MKTKPLIALALLVAATLLYAQALPPRVTLDFSCDMVDQGGLPTLYTAGEVKLVPAGKGSGFVSPHVLHPTVKAGINTIDISALLNACPDGEWDAWVRLKNNVDWGGAAGPWRFRRPATGSQPPQPGLRTSPPHRPQGLIGKVVIPVPEPPPVPPPGPVVTVGVYKDTDVPTLESGDLKQYELGMRFKAFVPGKVYGVRFYKTARNTGVHTGSLWETETNKLLATAEFTEESATGWQYVRFVTPVAIQADKVYIVSYWCPQGRFAAGIGGHNADIRNGNLIAPASGGVNAGNGIYRIGAGETMPATTYQNSKYYVDPLYAAEVVVLPPPPKKDWLLWDAPTVDALGRPLDDLAGYCLIRDGSCEPMGAANEWEIPMLLPGRHTFAAVAVDRRGNESVPSNEVVYTVQ